ncbi:MAG: phosphotransferase [Candidatus Competibacteraceae bacterium]|nr:phosphotransferase [Candidatus Competibacteraceae bacterium]MBK9950007.1 phosphotransferase [Candidatus Competibacteraceae bacterium]
MELVCVNDRQILLLDWLSTVLPTAPARIAPASSDASFRRYFRVWYDGQTRIVMDAPPDKEDCRPFVAIAQALRGLGLNAPEVLAADFERGLLLLTDLGDRQYLAELSEHSVSGLYGDALEALARLQVGGDPGSSLLPPYDSALLHREMELFRDWFLGRQVGLNLSEDEHLTLDQAFALLADNALEQPRVWVHRDYHSRNLMVTEPNNPGVLDFQDAVVGAVTYDLVSLLRDCYIAWPRERVEAWALQHRARLRALGMTGLDDAEQFLRWFDLMGVQRHLKATGIFARLNLRDGKPGYLQDIPRTLGYVAAVADRYAGLKGLRDLLLSQHIDRWEPAA